MQQKPSNTAILVFLRNEQEEAQIKTFHARLRMKRRVQIVQTLNRHVMYVTRQTGLPVFVIKGEQQVGATFGERFANAFEQVFAAGHEHVIAVGNDCLSLTKARLNKSASLFAAGNDIVLGPAEDGGAYIVGISKKSYDREAFLALPWRTNDVFEALLVYANDQRARLETLPIACDFDDAASFQRVIFHLASKHRIARILYHFLFSKRLQPVVKISLIESKFSSTKSLRAPPVAA